MSHSLPRDIDGVEVWRHPDSVHIRRMFELLNDHFDGCQCDHPGLGATSVIRFSRPMTEEELADWTTGRWVVDLTGRQ